MFCHVVVCLPTRPMEGMGGLQCSDLFTELPVPPQAAGVVGTFNVLLYIILSTTVSFLEDTILFLHVSSLFFIMCFSSCRCCMFVSCVHPVAFLNAVFCMIFSLLILVEDARADYTEEAYPRTVS